MILMPMLLVDIFIIVPVFTRIIRSVFQGSSTKLVQRIITIMNMKQCRFSIVPRKEVGLQRSSPGFNLIEYYEILL